MPRPLAASELPAAVRRQLGADPKPLPLPTSGVLGRASLPGDPRYRGMNQTERRYAAHLESQVAAGAVVWWSYEAVKLRLAPDSFYTPDFLVVLADTTLELHDVKGRKGDTFWAEEDARLKLRWVAAHYPFRLRVVWERAKGQWAEHAYN